MKKNRKITAILLSCLLLFTIPLHAAASEDLPEEADAVIAGEESVIEDSSDGSELTEDAAEPAGNAQAEDAGEPVQADQNEEEGNYIQPGQDEEPDGSALTEQTDQDGTVPAETEQSSSSDSLEEAGAPGRHAHGPADDHRPAGPR